VLSLIKKTRPITIRRRTIAAVLKGSLSETLGNAGVGAALAHKITNIYSWSIDFFKVKRRSFWCHFTERFINDSVYDGMTILRLHFFEYNGK
jgi:hypothetical protein